MCKAAEGPCHSNDESEGKAGGEAGSSAFIDSECAQASQFSLARLYHEQGAPTETMNVTAQIIQWHLLVLSDQM